MSAARQPRGCTPTTARATSCTMSGLTVAEGEITTLLGRNGAGKTTTLRSLIGLTPPRDGQRHDLRPRTPRAAHLPDRRARRRLRAGGPAHLRQPHGGGESAGADGAARPLDHGARLRSCSRGWRSGKPEPRPPALRRRAGDAVDRPRAAANPRLLILDEPCAGARAADRQGGVPDRRDRCAGEGISVLLVEQNVRMSLEIADRRLCARRWGRCLFRSGARAGRR